MPPSIQMEAMKGKWGELTPHCPCGKNPEIDNLSIFRIRTPNLVSIRSNGAQFLLNKHENRGRF